MQAPGPPKNKLLKVPSAPVELTPLTRLAKFKEIRDRNLAKASSASNPRRSIAAQLGSAKMMTNGSDGKSNTNGVAPSTNGNSEHHEEPSNPVKPKTHLKSGVEPLEPSPKKPQPSPKKAEPKPHKPSPSQNGADAVENKAAGPLPQNGGESQVQVELLDEDTYDVVILEEDEAGSGSEAEGDVENGRESEGSSLEVVIDDSSSGGSLDLHVSAVSAEDFLTPQKTAADVPVCIPGPSVEQEPALNVDEPYVPDVIKRLRSGGHISSRPTLRGKRRQEDTNLPGGKRHCDGSTSFASLSTSWQFFSPTSALKRVWNRQGEQPAAPKLEDDSMIVNVSTDPPKSQKWCRIM